MPPPDPPGPPGRLLRFTAAERWVHHATALLMLVCLVTAALLYVPALSAAVGRRDLLKPLHIWAGYALPLPVLFGLASEAFRLDLRRLDRFTPHDRDWLRRGDRRAVARTGGLDRGVVPVGKFNAGQKLNAAFTAGAILVLLGTGTIMTFPDPWPDRWRTGATFVHDWLFLLVLIVTIGHLWYALRDRGALGAMATGRVDRAWAARHHAGWLDEIDRMDEIDGTEAMSRPDAYPERHAPERPGEPPENVLKTPPDRS
ncbi:cytochrome b/b6 domain-containing protein [Spirillospora sp. NPDC029432]|uniref:cytochrome b/b6 domain-containing protein n=1 Tax=Spirillospora sp. NPDC029432 TaxID=3154599 RepID=UPI0034536051